MLSATLYTLYTNEITQLDTLMGTDYYTQITGQQDITYTDIDHIIINYVDESTNIVSSTDIKHLQTYINKYYILRTYYYKINFLKINGD